MDRSKKRTIGRKVMISTAAIKIRAFYRNIQRRIEGGWELTNKYSANYALYLLQAVRNFVSMGQHEAVGFAYWALFSLFPMVVLAIIIATSVFGSSRSNTRAGLNATLNAFIPTSESTIIQDSITNIIPRRNASYSILSVVGLIFGASKLFTHLQWSLGRIFRDGSRRPWYMQSLIGTTMVAVAGCLITMSLSLTPLFRLTSVQVTGKRSPVIEFGGTLALLIMNTVMLSTLYRFIPRRKIAWLAILPAAVLGALAWELGRSLFDWYIVHLANLGLVYGSLGALMGLLIWMFFIGCIISICAEIAVATDDWKQARVPQIAIEMALPNAPVNEAESTLATVETSDSQI
jgi:YihY family inner membrane protein